MPSTITKEERATLRDKWTAHYNRTSDPYSGDALRILDALETAESRAVEMQRQRDRLSKLAAQFARHGADEPLPEPCGFDDDAQDLLAWAARKEWWEV